MQRSVYNKVAFSGTSRYGLMLVFDVALYSGIVYVVAVWGDRKLHINITTNTSRNGGCGGCSGTDSRTSGGCASCLCCEGELYCCAAVLLCAIYVTLL